jgi:hypothetical protein
LPRNANHRALSQLRETAESLPISLTAADMAPIEIDKNFIGRSRIPGGGELE